jgi:hypothetical protein
MYSCFLTFQLANHVTSWVDFCVYAYLQLSNDENSFDLESLPCYPYLRANSVQKHGGASRKISSSVHVIFLLVAIYKLFVL